MALIMLKFALKIRQNAIEPHACAWPMEHYNMYAYDRQHEWLQGMLPTANGDRIIETQ